MAELSTLVEPLLPSARQAALLALEISRSLDGEGVSKQLGPRLSSCTLYAGGLCRRARRANTPHEFRSTLNDAAHYFDDAIYFIELLIDSGINRNDQLTELQRAASDLIERIAAVIEKSKTK